MIIKINKAILHILDFNSNVTIFSETELDTNNDSVEAFLTKHIEKSLEDSNYKTGAFLENSQFHGRMRDYINEEFDFIAFSRMVAETTHEVIAQSDKLDSVDVILVDFVADSQHFLGLLLCTNKVGFIHQVVQDTDKVRNDIINHYAILPSISQKLDGYAFIDLDSLDIRFFDKKRSINGESSFIIPERILQCSSGNSSKETIQMVHDITQKIADDYGQNSALAISKAKHYITENVEETEDIEPAELGKRVFAHSESMQEEFTNQIKNVGLPEKVKMDKKVAVKLGKNHKIKTDTGIELTIPNDYLQDTNYIEFINNSDGSISIQLKNIGKIINRK